MRKFINLSCRFVVMLVFMAPVAYTAHLLGNAGTTLLTPQYWLSVAPTAFICGIAWGVIDSKLEKEL